jgi:hypothetical protein
VDDVQLLGEVLERCTPLGEAGRCVEACARRPDVVEPEETTGFNRSRRYSAIRRGLSRCSNTVCTMIRSNSPSTAARGLSKSSITGSSASASRPRAWRAKWNEKPGMSASTHCEGVVLRKGAPRAIHGRDPAPVLENPEAPTEEVEEDIAAPHRMQTHAVSGVEGLEEIGLRLPVG